ncbi:hypothetical protein [Nonomuraea sp. LPB2021202275-12-8]|uniref:hypothetical protein n=1 Tax=Nonomuraea sp. LPB2021202275-12-8 TaxID=3120159 RepID=UPI00300CD6A3
MEIHRSQIRSAAEAFDEEKENLARFVTGVVQDLNSIGNFWGDGKEGVTFYKGEGAAKGYEAVTGQIIEGVEVLQEAHLEIPKRMRLMADNIRVTDWMTMADLLSKLPPADPDEPIWGEDG